MFASRDDERRRAREEDRRDRERNDVTPTRAAASGDLAPPRSRSGAFSATIDKLVRGCAENLAPVLRIPALQLKREWSPWPEFGWIPANLCDLSKG